MLGEEALVHVFETLVRSTLGGFSWQGLQHYHTQWVFMAGAAALPYLMGFHGRGCSTTILNGFSWQGLQHYHANGFS